MSYGPDCPRYCFGGLPRWSTRFCAVPKPGDIPVEQPTKFKLAINLTTAKLLGLSVPQTLLATADDIFE